MEQKSAAARLSATVHGIEQLNAHARANIASPRGCTYGALLLAGERCRHRRIPGTWRLLVLYTPDVIVSA